MKAKFLMFGLIISVILFLDYMLLTVIGCFGNMCGANADFYCTVFCKLAGFIVVGSTILPLGIAAYKTIMTKKI